VSGGSLLSGLTYVYDGNGNLARKISSDGETARQYLFNSLDQLTSAIKSTKSGSTWSSSTVGQYSYDANGMRAKTVEGSYTTEYVYVGHDPLCEKNGTAYTDYIYANGGLKVKLVGGSTYFCFDDALGSPWVIWQSGKTSATFSVKTYKPFGTPIVSTGTEKFRFANEIQDSPSGLYYIFARYYDPELGRFISLDPMMGKLSMPQTLDWYVYCVNNPLRFTDPTGEGSWPSGASHWWDKHWKTVVTIAVIVVAVAAIVLTAGAATPLAGLAVNSALTMIAVGAVAGTAINVGQYVGTQLYNGQGITAGGLFSSAVSGMIAGASTGAGVALTMMGHPELGLAVGAMGGEASYLFGKGIKAAAGEGGKITVGGMLGSAFFGAAGVGVGAQVGRVLSPLLGYSEPGIVNGEMTSSLGWVETLVGVGVYGGVKVAWNVLSGIVSRELGRALPLYEGGTA
jgi:RHS repeat-associated protein